MESEVAAALADAFPDREVVETRPPGPSWNERNRTVEVEFDDGSEAYLKVSVGGDPSGIVRERAVIPYLDATCRVPVPAVLASGTAGGRPYLATAPVGGELYHRIWGEADETKRVALAREVGVALARLHDRRFERHGYVVGGGADGLEIEAGRWSDVLVDTIEDLRAIAPDKRFDHHFDLVIDAVEDNRELLDDAPAALLHGDPSKPNCFRTDDGVGFLDWEITHVGDPVRDLHYTRTQHFDSLRSSGPEALVEAFHDGYRNEAGDLPSDFEERLPVYEAVRLLGTSGFFERVAAFHDEPREDLAEWVDTEMQHRLDRL